MNIKYEIRIYWSEQDNAYISEIPELDGCVADRKSPDEALKMLNEVYKTWLDSAKKFNVSVPKPKMGKRKLKVA